MAFVRKANGETELFSSEKLERSLKRSGADSEAISEIMKIVTSTLYDGITTGKIYNLAYSQLKKRKNTHVFKYKLKQAIMELGPTGHPFESFIGKIMEIQGYRTEVALTVDGFCVTHEVDVIATKDSIQYIVECKYGKSSDKTVNVQVPLYVKSRVDDIVRKREKIKEYEGFIFHGMVATNTRFSPDSISYAECSGLYLLGWDYPAGNGLKDIIDREKIYPITVLSSLNHAQKQMLLDTGTVICRQIIKDPKILESLDLNLSKKDRVISELNSVCSC
ncbi:MAG: ATP cone domain-containing protein [Candidatus Delongbacteria bacterium]|nr:ATP cone domain-containing protein [Candidatus Delongbacteria bacterium]